MSAYEPKRTFWSAVLTCHFFAQSFVNSVQTFGLFDQKAVGMTDTQSRNVQVTRARERAAHEATIAGVELSDPNSAVIIERSRAETALRESETRFRELADNISQFAWTADRSGWIYWYNKRWHDYTGTTLNEMEGWGWQKVHHPDHVDRVVQRIRQSFETGTPWEDTFPLRGRDGSYRWFLSRALPIRNEAGEVVRWFGTNTDVTEQIEAEKALRELNETLEQRVEAETRESNMECLTGLAGGSRS
jgi:PAS domain S-box-containing protein